MGNCAKFLIQTYSIMGFILALVLMHTLDLVWIAPHYPLQNVIADISTANGTAVLTTVLPVPVN